MSTNDVPGANEANRDVLRAGCWAEHKDGSLLLVEGTEGDKVIYELFDLADPADPFSFRDAMPDAGFKKSYSWPPVGKSKEKWTWHDKTPFPWSRVMEVFTRPRPRRVSAEQEMSAARRIAESLNLRGQRLSQEFVRSQTTESAPRGRGVWEKIGRAIAALRE